jgi:hypothetical protein
MSLIPKWSARHSTNFVVLLHKLLMIPVISTRQMKFHSCSTEQHRRVCDQHGLTHVLLAFKTTFIVHYHKQRVCDWHCYSHVVLAFNTFRDARYPDQKITDLSNSFTDIIYQNKTIDLARARNNAISWYTCEVHLDTIMFFCLEPKGPNVWWNVTTKP